MIRQAARLRLSHPGFRTCGVCEQWIWNQDGTPFRDSAGNPTPRTSDAIPTPCMSCPRVPAEAKSRGQSWRELRRAAFEAPPEVERLLEAHAGWRAVGRYPDDTFTTWVAAILTAERDAWERAERQREQGDMVKLIALAVRRATA